MISKVLPVLSFCVVLSCTAQDMETISVGDEMPAMTETLVTVDEKNTHLKELRGDNGTLVIFSCNTCPFVVGSNDSEGWEGRYNEVTELAMKSGISTILINSNEAKRDKGDGLADMKTRKEEQDLMAHYVLDENSVVADAFGARTTPHVFLFDKENVLAYMGAIDDNVGSAEDVKEKWLANAIDALRQGKECDPNTTRNKGCSIKRLRASR